MKYGIWHMKYGIWHYEYREAGVVLSPAFFALSAEGENLGLRE
jgi:hypothetical protein